MYGAAEIGSTAFVELPQVVPDGGKAEYHYELSLSSGHTLRLRRGFDSREVQALAAVLVAHA